MTSNVVQILAATLFLSGGRALLYEGNKSTDISSPILTEVPMFAQSPSPTLFPTTPEPTASPISNFDPQISSKLGNVDRLEIDYGRLHFPYTGNKTLGIYCAYINAPCSTTRARARSKALKAQYEKAAVGRVTITPVSGRKKVDGAKVRIKSCPRRSDTDCGFCMNGFPALQVTHKTALFPTCTNGRTTAHEMGHTFGLFHSGGIVYNSFTGDYRIRRIRSNGRAYNPYGDITSTMGSSFIPGNLFNIPQLYQLDWFADGEIKHIERGRVKLHRLDDVDGFNHVPKLRGLVFDDDFRINRFRHWYSISKDVLNVHSTPFSAEKNKFTRVQDRINAWNLKSGTTYKHGETWTCSITGMSFTFVSGNDQTGYVFDVEHDDANRISLTNFPEIKSTFANVRKGTASLPSQTRVTLKLGQAPLVDGKAIPGAFWTVHTATITDPNGKEYTKVISLNKAKFPGWGRFLDPEKDMAFVQIVVDDIAIGTKPTGGTVATGWTFKFSEFPVTQLDVKFF